MEIKHRWIKMQMVMPYIWITQLNSFEGNISGVFRPQNFVNMLNGGVFERQIHWLHFLSMPYAISIHWKIIWMSQLIIIHLKVSSGILDQSINSIKCLSHKNIYKRGIFGAIHSFTSFNWGGLSSWPISSYSLNWMLTLRFSRTECVVLPHSKSTRSSTFPWDMKIGGIPSVPLSFNIWKIRIIFMQEFLVFLTIWKTKNR